MCYASTPAAPWCKYMSDNKEEEHNRAKQEAGFFPPPGKSQLQAASTIRQRDALRFRNKARVFRRKRKARGLWFNLRQCQALCDSWWGDIQWTVYHLTHMTHSHFHSFVPHCLSHKHPHAATAQQTNIQIHVTIKLSCCIWREMVHPRPSHMPQLIIPFRGQEESLLLQSSQQHRCKRDRGNKSRETSFKIQF